MNRQGALNSDVLWREAAGSDLFGEGFDGVSLGSAKDGCGVVPVPKIPNPQPNPQFGMSYNVLYDLRGLRQSPRSCKFL